jgi:site-specific DNA-methyltransferase (adenine-specific)
MREIKDNSIDLVLCDLPYGITACKWDCVIPFEPLWYEYGRIVKDNAGIILNCKQPFTSALLMSNPKIYRHSWVWNKNNSAGFATVKFMPFQVCEDILVFGFKRVNYYPIMEIRGKPRKKGGYSVSDNYGMQPEYYPKNLINISNASQKDKVHPTQKPVELYEYMIKTYSNEGDLVLDNCAGSGTTGIACKNLGRNFILIEKEEKYCQVCCDRLGLERFEY